MYSEETIISLSERMGFGTPLEDGFAIELDEANSVGSTGRVFKSFHSLVTADNIFAALPNLGQEADVKFNEYLESLRYQATKAIVPLIMDRNSAYVNSISYDAVIEQNAILFDDAIGYKVAMMVLELFMTTNESNLVERNAKLAVSNLKLELEGFRNDNGILVASGLVQKLDRSIKTATNKIFPSLPTVEGVNAW